MADLQRTLGVVIRRERRSRDLTLKELAGRSALSVVYLSEIERGKKYPSASVLESLAGALQLEVSELLERLAAALRAVPETAHGRAGQEPARIEGRQEAHTLRLVEREERLAVGRGDRDGTAPLDREHPEIVAVSPESTDVAPAVPGVHLRAA